MELIGVVESFTETLKGLYSTIDRFMSYQNFLEIKSAKDETILMNRVKLITTSKKA